MKHIPTPEERKQFAKNQLKFLKEKGISNALHLSRIFKAAGPGQIQPAWELADQVKTQADKDILDCLIFGAGGSQNLSAGRMAAVLTRAGFKPPTINSDSTFFRVLDGTMEILFPGSFEFEPEELKEIEEGLERNKHNTQPGLYPNGN
jgi:hypothetical protein